MIFGADCAFVYVAPFRLCTPEILHEKLLLPDQLLGVGFWTRVCLLPRLLASRIKQTFLSYWHLFFEYWLSSIEHWTWVSNTMKAGRPLVPTQSSFLLWKAGLTKAESMTFWFPCRCVSFMLPPAVCASQGWSQPSLSPRAQSFCKLILTTLYLPVLNLVSNKVLKKCALLLHFGGLACSSGR